MKTICVANQKGGVGKTTLARNLAHFAIERGLRTLCVDLDPQKNFTKTLRTLRETNLGAPIDGETFLTASILFEDVALPTFDAFLAPMDCGKGAALIAAERELVDVAALPLDALFAPRAALDALASQFDVCIIDTAPTLGKPLYAALIAANFVVCPCTMDQDATDGLAELFEDIARVQQEGWNADLVPLGVLANCVNSRRVFDVTGLEKMREELGEMLLDGVLFERAATKYAKHRPLWKSQRGESHMLAAREMKAVCTEIFQKAML